MESGDKFRQLSAEEIAKLPGKLDKDGFHVLPEGDFYDPNGYYFDTNGYDQYGGYYEAGVYMPDYKCAAEYFDNYYHTYGEEEHALKVEEYLDHIHHHFGDELYQEMRSTLYPAEPMVEEEDMNDYNIEDYFSDEDEVRDRLEMSLGGTAGRGDEGVAP